MLRDGEKNAPWGNIFCQGTREKLVADAGADDVDCPVEAPGAVGAEPAGVVALSA